MATTGTKLMTQAIICRPVLNYLLYKQQINTGLENLYHQETGQGSKIQAPGNFSVPLWE